jgi:hypothetical protein
MTSSPSLAHLARIHAARLHDDAVFAPDDARLQLLAAELPEARAIERLDRDGASRALTIHVLTDGDD